MSMEILESRIAPAGIVTIEVSGGILELTGDDAGAEIIIEQISPKTFQITGVDTQLQGPDGLVSELIVSKVSSIAANFGNGNDTLEIWDATLKSLSLNLGGTAADGTNKATIHSSKTTGATQLSGGSGKDSVTFPDSPGVAPVSSRTWAKVTTPSPSAPTRSLRAPCR